MLNRKTALFFPATLDDLPDILDTEQMRSAIVYGVRALVVDVEYLEGTVQAIPRVEIDYAINPTGEQVILPSVEDRVQAAEMLINLILDEEEV